MYHRLSERAMHCLPDAEEHDWTTYKMMRECDHCHTAVHITRGTVRVVANDDFDGDLDDVDGVPKWAVLRGVIFDSASREIVEQ